MVIKKDGTRKIIALLAIMALLVSSSIALAQEIGGGEADPTKQEEPGEYNGPGDGPGDEPDEEPGEEPGDEPGEEPGEEPDEEPDEEPGEDEEPDEGEEADEDEEPGGDEEPGEDEELGGDEEPDEDEEPGGDEESGGDEEFTGGKGLDGVQTLGAPAGIGTQGLIDIETIVEVNMDFSVKAKDTAIVGEEVTFIYEAKYKNIKVTINTYLGSRLIKTDTITISSPMLVDYKITDDVIGEVHSKKYFTWFPGEVVRFEKTYKVKNDDNDPLENNASLMVVGSLGGYIIPTTYFHDSATVDILKPSIEVSKSADKKTVDVDDEITYTYTITNTGDVPLCDITLVDDKITDITLTGDSLKPDESLTATGTYTVTEEDGNNGSVTNTATVTAKYGEGEEDVVIAQASETVIVNPVQEQYGSITVIKTLDDLGGERLNNVEFKLYRYLLKAVDSDIAEDVGWQRTGKTDNGEYTFEDLECEGYYYILEEVDAEGYEVKYYLGTDSEGYDECPPIHLDCGEKPTIVYVVNTETSGEEPGDGDNDDDETSGGGGGSSSRRRTRRDEEEPVEVPEEPEVLTPPVAEEPVEEPVVVEEPMVTAPVLPALPHTGGNPAAFVIAGVALAGLGLYLRKRR